LADEAPLGSAPVDRSFAVALFDHVLNLVPVDLALVDSHLGVLGPGKPFDSSCWAAIGWMLWRAPAVKSPRLQISPPGDQIAQRLLAFPWCEF
jgi:hypothetical protein